MIRNAIQRFMYGRYGNDQLNVGLMVLYLVLYLLYWLTGADLLYWVSMVVLFTALFRLLSRSHAKRRAENAKFLQAVVPLLKWYRLRRTIRQDKEHCYLGLLPVFLLFFPQNTGFGPKAYSSFGQAMVYC